MASKKEPTDAAPVQDKVMTTFSGTIVTKAQRVALFEQTPQTLAEWWCTLNRWEWPDGLPDPESPSEFHETSQSVRWAIQCWISKEIGERAISREWNKDMPDDVFNDFWRKHSGDRSAGALYSQWSAKESRRLKSS